MPFDSDGFFAPDVAQWTAEHRRVQHRWFNLAERLNRHCHKVAFALPILRENNQHLLCATLFLRTIEYFQAAVMLAERGMNNAAKVALRTQLETVFSMTMISTSLEHANTFVLTDAHTRRSALKKIKRAVELGILSAEETAQNEAALEECEKELNASKIPRPTVEWLAQQADMESSYLITYAHLSGPVHSLSRNLESYIAEDTSGNTSHLTWGPDARELVGSLATGIEYLSCALRAIEKVFDVDKCQHDLMHEEFVKLFHEHALG